MSAAAARRRKQLAARKAEQDVVGKQLQTLLEADKLDEPEAYEAMQLAQSVTRKKVHQIQFQEATELAYKTALALLKKNRIAVASQLLTLLQEVLKETHTMETQVWLDRITELSKVHSQALEKQLQKALDEKNQNSIGEILRLHRLQREWLREILQWSISLGDIRYGHYQLHECMASQCWYLTEIHKTLDENGNELSGDIGDESDVMDLRCEAIQHMVLAEKPMKIIEWLKTLKKPTASELLINHGGTPCQRDALLTRSVLFMIAIENVRDAQTLVRAYIKDVEERDMKELATSYTNKEDGKAPAHVMFCSMLIRTVQKEQRTGPLFSWLLRSFRYELDRMHKSTQIIQGFTTKIGKVYFNIQPPPSMMDNMMNMMNMMGGMGGMGGPGGNPLAGIDPAMMQAALGAMAGGQPGGPRP